MWNIPLNSNINERKNNGCCKISPFYPFLTVMISEILNDLDFEFINSKSNLKKWMWLYVYCILWIYLKMIWDWPILTLQMLEILVFHTTKVLVNRNVISFKNFKQIQQFILNLKFNKYYYAKHVILQISKFLCPEIGLSHYYMQS